MLAASRVTDGVAAVLVGGYFGTWHELRAVAGLPISKEWLWRIGGAPGAGVLAACGLAETARVLGYLADQNAGRCGPCAPPAVCRGGARRGRRRRPPDSAPLERRRVELPSRLHLDPAACTGQGLCADLRPELVELDEWGFPMLRADAVGPDPLPHARRAVTACPTLALRLLRSRENQPASHR